MVRVANIQHNKPLARGNRPGRSLATRKRSETVAEPVDLAAIPLGGAAVQVGSRGGRQAPGLTAGGPGRNALGRLLVEALGLRRRAALFRHIADDDGQG